MTGRRMLRAVALACCTALGLAALLSNCGDDEGGHGFGVSSTRNKAPLIATAASQARLIENYGKLSLAFEANEGQTDSGVKFFARGKGYGVFLMDHEAILALDRRRSLGGVQVVANKSALTKAPKSLATAGSEAALVRLKLDGANGSPQISGLDELPGRSNYFIGHNPKRWRTGVTNYAEVKYASVYPGIDLIYHGNQRHLECDFVLAPGADPHRISWNIGTSFAGTSRHKLLGAYGKAGLYLDSQGALLLEADGEEVRFPKPVAYQWTTEDGLRTADQAAREKHFIDVHYVLTGQHKVAFRVGSYDARKSLVIDPVLVYSTYLGGSKDDAALAIAIDSQGSAYLTGATLSTNFPVANALQSGCASCGLTPPNADAFVTKFSADGSTLVYSTYLGGKNLDEGTAIAVDSSGNVYLTGVTASVDFPIKNSLPAPNNALQGMEDAFVAELDATGSALVYSTYLGGKSVDGGLGIALDSSGDAYVTGFTQSADFPTKNPLPAPNNSLRGTQNVFVTKLNAVSPGSPVTLAYSTYLGGSETDSGNGIAVDASGSAYVTGQTSSNNFPTANPIQATFRGAGDAFVTKLSSDGTQMVYSTYVGGSGVDGGATISLDSSGDAFIAGSTNSADFPTTAGAFQTTFRGGGSDGFVVELNAAGSALVYSTYLGGSNSDAVSSIAIDSSGRANVIGITVSSDFPTANAIQSSYTGNQDVFVTRLVPTGCGVSFSTYLGGHATDIGSGIAFDSFDNIYVAGATFSNDFPLKNPFQGATGGGYDAFVAKIGNLSAPVACFSPTSASFSPEVVASTSSAETVMLTNSGDATLNIQGIASNGDFAETNTCGNSVNAGQNCSISVTFTPTGAGSRLGQLSVTDDAAGSPQQLALSGVGADFGMSVSPAQTSVNAGQAATYTLTVTASAGFSGNVSLTCSGAPPSGTCAVSPSSVMPTQDTPVTANVTVSTKTRSLVVPLPGPDWPLQNLVGTSVFLWLLSLSMLSMLALTVRRCRHPGWVRFRLVVPFASVILLVLLWTSCGVFSSPSGTPAGSYSLTVTGAVGTLTHSVTTGLTVN